MANISYRYKRYWFSRIHYKVFTYKIKKNSSSGGHNGIKSIIELLNSDAFSRIKVGIGKEFHMPVDKYVLSKFSTEEQKSIESNFDIYNRIIDDFINNGYEYIINNQSKYWGVYEFQI